MIKNVAIVVCAFPPQGGGIGNNADYHLNQLLKIGYFVKLFSPEYKNIKKVINSAVNYLPVTLPIGKAGFIFSLYRRLRSFDIIHLYYPFFGTDLIVLCFKLLHPQKKLIIHYQMDAIGRGYQKIIFKLYLKIILPLLIRISDKIIILSWDNAKHSYLQTYLHKFPNKFVEIPNGIDTEIFKPKLKNLALINKYHLLTTDKLIIFAGGLDDQHFFKGVDVLLKAFLLVTKENKSAKLMIIGDGNRRATYEQLALDLGISDKVIFTGWIDNQQLPDYYNLGDIFVLPSTERTESFGIVIAEAQACGLPAIVSNWPGSRITIFDGQTGYVVEPKNENDLYLKIMQLINNDSLRQNMSQASVVRAQAKYDWQSVIIKIVNLYKNL